MSSQDQPAKRSAMLFDFIFDFQNRSKFFTRLAPIPLRLIVGYGFMEHGFAKLGRGADSFAFILHAIGTPASTPIHTLSNRANFGFGTLEALCRSASGI
jgi:hypothetical protein